jgi:hypothetical protein
MKIFKLLLILSLLFGFLSTAYAQETITPEDAANSFASKRRFVEPLRAPILQPSQKASLPS